jgi:two-component system, OmpR family, response regulator
MMRVVIVEDDESLAYLLRRLLRQDGYAIDVAMTGEEARVLVAANDYEGMVLDLQLTDCHGLELLQDLRKTGMQTAVLVYTGNSDARSIIAAFEAGADEYVVKPVSNDEMRSRVRALLRRGDAAKASEELSVGGLTLNRLTRRVTFDGFRLDLTATELRLLEQMMLHAGEVVTRSELHDNIWGMHFDPSSNVIDAHVARLRKKLEQAGVPAAITARRSVGFILCEAQQPAAGAWFQ